MKCSETCNIQYNIYWYVRIPSYTYLLATIIIYTNIYVQYEWNVLRRAIFNTVLYKSKHKIEFCQQLIYRFFVHTLLKT